MSNSTLILVQVELRLDGQGLQESHARRPGRGEQGARAAEQGDIPAGVGGLVREAADVVHLAQALHHRHVALPQVNTVKFDRNMARVGVSDRVGRLGSFAILTEFNSMAGWLDICHR